MNTPQRQLRRRSPSDVSDSTCSIPSQTKQQKIKLHRSTTIEEIEYLNNETVTASGLILDLNTQTPDNETTSILRQHIPSYTTSVSSSSSSSDSSSESDESYFPSCDIGSSLEESFDAAANVDDDNRFCFQNKSTGFVFERSLTEEIERQLDEVDSLVCNTGINDDDNNHVHKYHAKRIMTPTQEKWNALTMIPPAIYCVYYILAGVWIDPSSIQLAKDTQSDWLSSDITASDFLHVGCFDTANSTILQHVPALPPLPVLAVVVAVVTHAPFSFLYHWTYATRPGAILHWSRRMDQAMIHIASAFLSYATSGNVKYFLLTLLFNLDCCYKQLAHAEVKPRRNQIRVFLAVLLYTLPLLRRDELRLFMELWIVLLISAWLFAAYPFGGWSHSLFHVVSFLVPPLLMIAALKLPDSQQQVIVAAQCIVRSTAVQ